MTFIYAVGPSYSGKSEYGKYLKSRGYEIVSSDAIRNVLYGDESIQGNPNEVFKVAAAETLRLLDAGRDVYFDSTGLKAKYRLMILRAIKKYKCYKKCILFLADINTIKERMAKRDRYVPEQIIHRQISNFEVPCYGEGWDSIDRHIVGNGSIINRLYDAMDISHNNPHHQLTIGAHMIEAHRLAVHYGFNEVVRGAAMCHDIGKPVTKVFSNIKGEPTDIAHYYHHENWSAYLYCLESNHLRWLDIANLIQWHMAPWFYGDKKLRVLRQRLGEELWQDLNDLHQCDMEAH